ncbi:MAG: esterase, partial [Halieaceae bacterium]|nr:esterase [Halieaceae bacterium]
MNNSLHAVSSGEGKDVILLHGLFGQGSNLRGIARALELHFRVHCLDLPDHGRSPWLSSASLEAYSDEVLKWMNGRQICKSHMIGHSLGGKVAMQL